MTLKIKYLSELIGTTISPPTYATEGSAGIDLRACISSPVVIEKGESVLIPTGIAIELASPDCAAFIYARSGLGIKHNICLSNGVGVIDSDYRGEIMVGLLNLGTADYTIAVGERIAQMVLAPIIRADLIAVSALSDTARGTGGFGSTGRV